MAETNNVRSCFNRHRKYADVILNHHEIDKAVQLVVGERSFDKKIRDIWWRVIREKRKRIH